MRLLSILHVDDDEIDRESFARELEACNVVNHLYQAVDGEDALAQLREPGKLQRPLMILLDLKMPKMDGLEFLAALRADEDPENRALPVVVLTSSTNHADLKRAHELGISGYILKPVVMANFTKSVAAMGRWWALWELPHTG